MSIELCRSCPPERLEDSLATSPIGVPPVVSSMSTSQAREINSKRSRGIVIVAGELLPRPLQNRRRPSVLRAATLPFPATMEQQALVFSGQLIQLAFYVPMTPRT